MDRRMVARVSRVGICAMMLAAACSSGGSNLFDNMAAQQAAESAVFPAAEWSIGDPVELGFDAAMLDQIASEADPLTSCILVTRHGEIVDEWYYNDTTAEQPVVAFSVTQTFTSTLVGIAQDEGLLDIDDPVGQYIPELADAAEGVTVRDILSHVTGRESTNSIGNWELYEQLLAATDPAGFAIGLAQEHEPGTVWSQNLPAIELLGPILSSATGMDPAEYAEQKLFGPIGATHTEYSHAPNGETWMHNFLQTTCRDMARLGYLFLRNGNWNGTQVVSEEWVAEATSPSQDLNRGWGFMWWLNEPGSLVSIENVTAPDYDEPSNLQLNPAAPQDMYWALGLGGRFIQVHPETDTVVVRLGDGDEAANMQQVTRLVTEALIE